MLRVFAYVQRGSHLNLLVALVVALVFGFLCDGLRYLAMMDVAISRNETRILGTSCDFLQKTAIQAKTDSKSADPCDRGGSTPPPGTN
jgi:hypothetical protein